MELARAFRALSDITRLRIVQVLRTGPRCVGDLQRILGVSQVQVSKHLALLREAELVTCHTHRQQRIYTLESEPGPAIGPVLQAVDQVALLEPQLRRDRERASALRPIPVPKAHVLQESETSLPSRLL